MKKIPKPKTILGIQMDTEFIKLQQIAKKEIKALSYPQQWLVIRYLPLGLLAKLARDSNSLLEIASLHNTRPTNLLRAEVKLQSNKGLGSLCPSIFEEVLSLLKPHGNFTANEVTRNLLSIFFNEFLMLNPESTLTGYANHCKVSKIEMFNLVRSTEATVLYKSKETKELHKVVLPNIDDRFKLIESELASMKTNRGIILNALLSLATTNPKVYANLKDKLGEL